jgi:DNA-directed RNA polymerase subunit E'
MFKLIKCQDVIRIPPGKFSEDLKKVSIEELAKKYEGTLSKELGYVVAVVSAEVSEVGKILPGDGATYNSVTFTLLTYKPEVQEIVEGEVAEVGDFGAFVRIGPMEALLHISQIIDDYVVYDEKHSTLMGKETKRKLSVGDKVRARITAVSLARGGTGGKIGITMRQPFLGKLEWIKEDIAKLREAEKVEAEKKKAKAGDKK